MGGLFVPLGAFGKLTRMPRISRIFQARRFFFLPPRRRSGERTEERGNWSVAGQCASFPGSLLHWYVGLGLIKGRITGRRAGNRSDRISERTKLAPRVRQV